MNEWVECNNLEALKQKTAENDVERYWCSDDTWEKHADWTFPPGSKYRYRVKPAFEKFDKVLCWNDYETFIAGDYGEINPKNYNKIIPLQYNVVEAERLDSSISWNGLDMKSMIAMGESGRFMILRIPE